MGQTHEGQDMEEKEWSSNHVWSALSQTPGVGVSITNREGRLIFVNDTTKVLFSDDITLDYQGKFISDYHPPEFVKERLEMIARVLDEDRPLSIEHIYRGKRIESTVWPLPDEEPPSDRVLVVSQSYSADAPTLGVTAPEVIRSEYIDLGPLGVLTRRELEVLALLGHGMSVPSTASMLHRSPKTIERHKSAISQKLNIRGQADMVEIVTRIGLDLSDASLKRLHRS
ncbi:MAG: LuxR C-terminal-related transcriptional regulator [Planctomycetota bacterium]